MPHWRRRDVTREADLIEEVARHRRRREAARDAAAARAGCRRPAHATPSACAAAPRTCSSAAACYEIAGWSFTEPAVLDRLRLPADDRHRSVVELREPDERDAVDPAPDACSASLLDAARHNLARGATDLALFESAAVYRAGGNERRLPRPRSTCSARC